MRMALACDFDELSRVEANCASLLQISVCGVQDFLAEASASVAARGLSFSHP
jgi:hypothetical protein